MASYVPPAKNGADGLIFYTSLAPRTANGAWQSNPTIKQGDVKISLDGGSLANLTTTPAVTPASSKLVKVMLSQAETNADNLAIVFSDTSGAEWCDRTINVQTVTNQLDSLATAAAVPNLVWDELDTGHNDTGTYGRLRRSVNVTKIRGDTGAADRLLKFSGTALSATGYLDTGTGGVRLDTGAGAAPNIVAIRAKTDNLTFTVASQVDANIRSVNSTLVTGTGDTGANAGWGPA